MDDDVLKIDKRDQLTVKTIFAHWLSNQPTTLESLVKERVSIIIHSYYDKKKTRWLTDHKWNQQQTTSNQPSASRRGEEGRTAVLYNHKTKFYIYNALEIGKGEMNVLKYTIRLLLPVIIYSGVCVIPPLPAPPQNFYYWSRRESGARAPIPIGELVVVASFQREGTKYIQYYKYIEMACESSSLVRSPR
jgi:hypothetical protein